MSPGGKIAAVVAGAVGLLAVLSSASAQEVPDVPDELTGPNPQPGGDSLLQPVPEQPQEQPQEPALLQPVPEPDGQVVPIRITQYYPWAQKKPGQSDASFKAVQQMEGGIHDRAGKPLYSLDDFLLGNAPYVSLSCDYKGGPPLNIAAFRNYGQRVSIPDIDAKVGQSVDFRLVDDGGHFFGPPLDAQGLSDAEIKAAIQQDGLLLPSGVRVMKVIRVPGYEPIDLCRRPQAWDEAGKTAPFTISGGMLSHLVIL